MMPGQICEVYVPSTTLRATEPGNLNALLRSYGIPVSGGEKPLPGYELTVGFSAGQQAYIYRFCKLVDADVKAATEPFCRLWDVEPLVLASEARRHPPSSVTHLVARAIMMARQCSADEDAAWVAVCQLIRGETE